MSKQTWNISGLQSPSVTDWGMEVHAVDLFAVSVINYPLLARQTEQNRSKEEEVTKKMFNLLKDHRVSGDVNDDKNAPLDYLGGRFLFFFLFRGGDENHSLSIPFRQQFLNNKNYETNPIQVFFNSILHCCCLRTCKIISLFNELTCHTHRMHFIMAVQFIIEDHCRWSHFPCPRLIYPHFR